MRSGEHCIKKIQCHPKYHFYKDGYDLNKSVDEIRANYFFEGTCQGSVPNHYLCLESNYYEDAFRNAVSLLGGDSDTLAAIAEALPGIPDELIGIVKATII